MKEFNPSRNLCVVAAILMPMTAEQQEWLRLGGDNVGMVVVGATGIDLTDPDHPSASTRDARKFFQFVCEGDQPQVRVEGSERQDGRSQELGLGVDYEDENS